MKNNLIEEITELIKSNKEQKSQIESLRLDKDRLTLEKAVLLNLVKDLKAVIDRNDETYQMLENDKAEIKEMKQAIKAKLEKLILQEKPKSQHKAQLLEDEINEWETI